MREVRRVERRKETELEESGKRENGRWYGKTETSIKEEVKKRNEGNGEIVDYSLI